ncbi:KRP95-like protein [Mya arenaria]|uniref:Kinesin-like protein n=1 Tax=Mya arenaria TaxID=6604 RepID=A0ABY7E3F4_MYAAR|nr:KRP95-like protein [Mya arenaria]
MNTKKGIIELKNPKLSAAEPKKTFTFDSVYDWNSKQRDLYDETFRDLVDNVLQGFNGTIFAYGQTGTGKTFTMQGVKNDPELRGVIPNSFEHIFNHISNSENQQYLVRASYLEIYQDLSSFVTKSVREIEHVMNVGNQNRSVGATDMNEHSSRSHAIFIITIECSEEGEDGENHIRVGRLNLVDLAGSERQAKTKAEGQRLKEATKINLSLSALGNVISALVDGKSTHIPYRDSKLTRLLQDSLGGNAKTVMVANIGPADYNFDETMSTLRYANRAKNIKNKPKINEDPKDALLREFQEEIARLKASLAGRGGPKKKKKRRTRRNDNGEIISESEEEDDDEEEEEIESKEEDLEAYRQEQQANLEKEKESILNNRSMMQAAMESKLLVGNIVDHTNEQQRALEQRRREIAEQQRVERDIQQKLEEKEEAAVDLQETYVSLQQEVEVKTKKLKKLFAKLQATKQEIQDLQEEHVKERQELEQTQNELTRELKLKLLIIENFIPIEDKVKIQNRANFDEEQDTWVLRALANKNAETMAKRPKSALGNRRPVSEYARMAAAMGGNPRFKGENIIMVELDMPNRTTRDYDGPQVAPRIQAALDAALQDEADLELDGSPAIFKTDRKRKDAGKSRPKSALKSNVDKSQLFPKARGLVNKN